MQVPLRIECGCGSAMHINDSHFISDLLSEKEIVKNQLPKNAVVFTYGCFSCGNSIKIYAPFELENSDME